MDKNLQQAAFQLYLWHHAGGNNFTCQLYSLIAKADLQNRGKLRRAFPTEVLIFEEWQNAETSKDFFKKYKVGLESPFSVSQVETTTIQKQV